MCDWNLLVALGRPSLQTLYAANTLRRRQLEGGWVGVFTKRGDTRRGKGTNKQKHKHKHKHKHKAKTRQGKARRQDKTIEIREDKTRQQDKTRRQDRHDTCSNFSKFKNTEYIGLGQITFLFFHEWMYTSFWLLNQQNDRKFRKEKERETGPRLLFSSFHFSISTSAVYLSLCLACACLPYHLSPLPFSISRHSSASVHRPSSFLLPPPSFLFPPSSSYLLSPPSYLLPPSLLPPTYSLDSKCHIPMVPLRSH